MTYMFVATLLFTSLVSAVKLSSEERIKRNQHASLQKTVLKALGIPIKDELSSEDLYTLFKERVDSIKTQGKNVYVGYEEDGESVKGYAFPVGGPGFWGPIHGIAATGPQATRIVGIAFYKHSETPGLGGRLTEAWFTEQFNGLPLYPIKGEKKIFYLTPEGSEKAPNELDAITGATRTSHAVEAFLNRELDRFLRELWESAKERS